MTNLRMAFVTALLLCAGSANAAFINLVPTTPVTDVNTGDLVSFDVVMDFTDYTNGTLGGGFDIFFDSLSLQFVSLVNNMVGDPGFGRDPDILDGLLESWGVGDFNGIFGFNVLGSVVFQVLDTMGASTVLGTQATNGIAGPWVDGTTFVDLIPVDYGVVEVTRADEVVPVPEPGVLALLCLGLAGIAIFRRRTKPGLVLG